MVDSILRDLLRWSNGRRLSETSTYDVIDGSDLLKTYLVTLQRHRQGDYLLGLWNQLPGNSNRIASIGHDDIVGSATAEFTDIDGDRIPGFATYFWVMPEERKVAAIRVKHAMNGIRAFEHYMKNFLQFINPNHVVVSDEGGEDEIIVQGYKPTQNEQDVLTLYPKFAIGSIQKQGDSERILANRHDIKKIICKTTLTNTAREDRTIWQKGLDAARLNFGERYLTAQTQIKVELPLTFTQQELQHTLNEWGAHLRATRSAWDDIGFVMRGEPSPIWLGKSYARKGFSMDVEWIDEEQVQPAHLLSQLVRRKAEVIAIG
ncbi:hypothetical protein U875_09760 [Pandoraea pnomenusa 3kgm]|nr:hypothetical protein U875_09760 [Pandoraea pnomenusa 3kgm]